MASAASMIKLETFQATDFNVASLVEGLMEEDVRQAKVDGGGELWPLASVCTAWSGVGDVTLAAPLSDLVERAIMWTVAGAKAHRISLSARFRVKLTSAGRAHSL